MAVPLHKSQNARVCTSFLCKEKRPDDDDIVKKCRTGGENNFASTQPTKEKKCHDEKKAVAHFICGFEKKHDETRTHVGNCVFVK